MKLRKTIALFLSSFVIASGSIGAVELSSTPATAATSSSSSAKLSNTFTKTNLDGYKKYYKKNSKVALKGSIVGAGREILIMRYNTSAKKWDIIKTVKTDKNGNFSHTIAFTKNAKYAVHASATSKYKGVSSYSTEFTSTAATPKVSYFTVQYARTVPWQQNHASGYIQGLATNTKPTVELQKKSGSKWVKSKSYTISANNKFMLNLPKGSKTTKDQKLQYRFVYKGTGIKTTTSKTYTITFDNPTKGNKQERTAYSYVKSYCSNTAIIIGKTPSGTWGTAQMSKNTITLNPAIPSKHLRTVALHECGHQKQWALYGSNWNAFLTKMNKVYGQKGSKGMEQNADCIANYWHKNSYFGYNGNCKGAKATAAKYIANGKKY